MALDPNIVSETINIGPDEGTITVKELAELVAKETGFEGDAIHMPDRPREVKHASCSADKARRLLNYETKTVLEKGIQETVAYVRNKGPKDFDYSYPLEIISDKTPATWKNRLM
jgi:UDP-glucose 4-epimerase